MHHRPLLLLAPLVLAGAAAAQTEHFVDNGPGFDFVPQNLQIQVGDTVTWVWKGGVHTIYSSTGGLPNGIFGSGTAVGDFGHTFSVTFDAAFLAANPVPGSVYEYICTIHVSSGQIGYVEVLAAPSVTSYGCANPPGSLTSVSGQPKVGASWTVAVDNPLDTQAAGSLAFLAGASQAAPGYPCGLAVPGFGMAGAGAPGEILIALAAPNPILTVGPQPWNGAPAPFALQVPALPSLAGASVFLQGVLYDPSPSASVVLGMTEGLAVTIGS